MRHTLVISSGDPAGIGPEVTVKALADPEILKAANWIVVGEDWVLAEAARASDWAPQAIISKLQDRPPGAKLVVWAPGAIRPQDLQVGQVSRSAGQAAVDYIRLATAACLDQEADALVTAPVGKEAVSLTGIHFTGHTEYIAELVGAANTRMLLANDTLRVVHVTTHCSLAAATAVDETRVFDTITLGHAALVQLGYRSPRIAVCGLNPHAGENGLFGDAEQRVIEPAIRRARSQGIDCGGPYPADTLFLQAVRGRYDLVVAMYHDQGHIPMKLIDFEQTVNVTLGLPIIRTSVDHGTAYDIAGDGLANPDHMKQAIRFALRMCAARSLAMTAPAKP